MQEYIIGSRSPDSEKYISYDNHGKFTVVTSINKAARFANAGKAWNVLQNQMSKKMRDGWMVMSYGEAEEADVEEQCFHANIDMSSVDDKFFDWSLVEKNITKSFSDIIEYKEYLTKKLDQINAELCDCEHACEFLKCDAAHGYKLYAMIRERRIKRRYYKDELRKVSVVLDMSYTSIASGKIKELFKEIEEQVYEPRVLKELFEDVLCLGKREPD